MEVFKILPTQPTLSSLFLLLQLQLFEIVDGLGKRIAFRFLINVLDGVGASCAYCVGLL